MGSSKRRSGIDHRFEGTAVLSELLAAAGGSLEVEEIAEGMRAAQKDGEAASDVIPTLFEAEPHFPDPGFAQRLYQNLLGLWDLAGEEGPLALEPKAPVAPARPKKKAPPEKPPRFGLEGPDETYVERAWRYLDAVEGRELERLEHAFENRQDALLVELDSGGLDDQAFAFARQLLFELFVMIELGWPEAAGKVVAEVPQALTGYAGQALLEAELEDSPQVREAVTRGLSALWSSRRRYGW